MESPLVYLETNSKAEGSYFFKASINDFIKSSLSFHSLFSLIKRFSYFYQFYSLIIIIVFSVMIKYLKINKVKYNVGET